MRIVNFLLIIGMICLLSLTACDKSLPPSPPPLGDTSSVGRAMFGMAGAKPQWAAEPTGVILAPKEVSYGEGLVATVSGYDYVYGKGYYFDSIMREWTPFYLTGEKAKSWIKGIAIGTFPVSKAVFKTGDNYIVIYGCSKVQGEWSCNNRRWMLKEFKVKEVSKELAGAGQFMLNKNIAPFEVRSLNAGADDFEGVSCTRYDAHYRDASSGLLVVSHVFNFKTQQDVDNTVNGVFKDVFDQGYQNYNGHGVGLFLDLEDRRVAVWPSGLNIVFIETYTPAFAAKEIVEAYLEKYPSSLQR